MCERVRLRAAVSQRTLQCDDGPSALCDPREDGAGVCVSSCFMKHVRLDCLNTKQHSAVICVPEHLVSVMKTTSMRGGAAAARRRVDPVNLTDTNRDPGSFKPTRWCR